MDKDIQNLFFKKVINESVHEKVEVVSPILSDATMQA